VTRRKRGTGRLEQTDLARMKEMIIAGHKAVEIAPRFGVSSTYVYQLKMSMKKKGELADVPAQEPEQE
jgi:transposase